MLRVVVDRWRWGAALLERTCHACVPPYDIAQLYAGLGDAEQLFAWLQKAEREHAPHVDTLAVNPIMDAFHGDSRMPELVARSGLGTGLAP